MRGVLAWLDFLTGELDIPIATMKDGLRLLESVKTEELNQEQLNSLKILQESCSHLTGIVEDIANLARTEALGAGAFFDEVDIENLIRWVLDQLRGLAEQRQIKTDLEIVGQIGRIIGDKRTLTQSLLYVMRNEILSSPPESRLHICLVEKNEEFINIEITNPQHYISTRALNSLLREQPDTSQQRILKNGIYPARILMQGLGGGLEITSKKKTGTNYIIKIPKKWQNWMHEIDTLRLATEISRKEAQDMLKNVHRLASSLIEKEQPSMKDSYDRINGKIQELGVLCNRSLFLADDLSIRLEAQQDRLLLQEVEQLTTLEAILAICRDIAHSIHLENTFDLESAKRVAWYALSIADEFKMSGNDRQALRYATLFKDLGIVLSPSEMIKQKMVSKVEEAMAVKARYDPILKSLLNIRYLTTAMDFVLYRHEKYDGTGGHFGVKGTDIPFGARILAIADNFDAMTSGQSPQGKLTPKLAMKKIVEGSGLCFDPHIVNAFLTVWKKKELHPATAETF